MNRADFVREVADRAEITQGKADDAINAVFDALRDLMVKGDEFHQVGFGKFGSKQRSARQGMNPATGEMTTYPAKRVPTFQPGSKLKAAVAE